MTAMQGVVDMSGAVSATLQSYRAVLLAYQQKVTGDPAALRGAAQALRTDGDQLSACADTIQQGADSLGASWSGTAYNAYHASAGKLEQDIRSAASALRQRADELNRQAAALESARHDMDAIIQWFDNAANQQIAAAANAAAGAVGLFQAAADQLGRQAVELAKQVADLLGKQLVGPETEGLTLFDYSTSGHSYGETFSNGVLLQGGGYYSLGPRLSVKPGYELGSDGTKISGVDLSLLKAGASGSISDGQTTVAGDIDANVGANAAWQHGDLDLGAEAKVHGKLAVTEQGVPVAQDKLEASADAHGHLKIGQHGVSEDVGFGRSAEVTGTYSAEGGGVKFDAMGGVGVGLKDQESLTATYDHGHLKLGVGATVIDGIGAKGSVNLDIDLPKVGGEIADGARSLYNGATSAAQALGESYLRAMRDYPGWSLP